MSSTVHIVSFDIPFPANYGGVIDVYHKLRCLKKAGVSIILHCFKYGNKQPSPELEILCKKVYYYERNTSWLNQLSLLPYNVKSRINAELKQNLLKDNYPIIFEVLHTCYLLNDVDLKARKKIYRHSNIEHDYFIGLAMAEKSFFKKMYLIIEAMKLKRFEKQITHASCILSVSENDLAYFKANYPTTPSYYLPSFHQFDTIESKTGKGDYILYHGNLSISENYNAAIWLIDNVFSKIKHPVIIAGLNPSPLLIVKIKKHPHITLKQNCSNIEMNDLIANAQIHCLYTEQGTGLKLKLLNVLFSGRFVLTNLQMLIGTNLHDACVIANTPSQFINEIEGLFEKPFTKEDIEKRKNIISIINNQLKTDLLLTIISN